MEEVYGIYDTKLGIWVRRNANILHGPACVIQAEYKSTAGNPNGDRERFIVARFNEFGQPFELEPEARRCSQ
jgi:hypothetical protein